MRNKKWIPWRQSSTQTLAMITLAYCSFQRDNTSCAFGLDLRLSLNFRNGILDMIHIASSAQRVGFVGLRHLRASTTKGSERVDIIATIKLPRDFKYTLVTAHLGKRTRCLGAAVRVAKLAPPITRCTYIYQPLTGPFSLLGTVIPFYFAAGGFSYGGTSATRYVGLIGHSMVWLQACCPCGPG